MNVLRSITYWTGLIGLWGMLLVGSGMPQDPAVAAPTPAAPDCSIDSVDGRPAAGSPSPALPTRSSLLPPGAPVQALTAEEEDEATGTVSGSNAASSPPGTAPGRLSPREWRDRLTQSRSFLCVYLC